MKIKNVLSLFDGLSCGQIALNRCGISYDNYYASEVDKYAMKVTQANYPNTIQLGDVTNLKKQHIEKPDLIMGGFPCQAFSNAGKQLGLEDVRRQLLFYMLDVIKYYKPKYFLMENVKGLLSKKFQPVIDLIYRELAYIGCNVQHTLINSALVSAQNRERVYFTNFDVSQPEDEGILLKDVLEENVICGEFRPHPRNYKDLNLKRKERLERQKDDKSNCLRSGKNNNVFIYQTPRGNNPGGLRAKDGKTPCLSSNSWEHNNKIIKLNGQEVQGTFTKNYFQYDINETGHKSATSRAYYENKKHGTLDTFCRSTSKVLQDGFSIRKLTPVECERLQTVPDNYTNHVSNSQRYKMLGNGWTVEVICHIFKEMLKKEEEIHG